MGAACSWQGHPRVNAVSFFGRYFCGCEKVRRYATRVTTQSLPMKEYARDELHKCILTGLALATGVATALVALSLYVPPIAAATETDAFKNATLGALLAGLLLMVVTMFMSVSHTTQRLVQLFVAAAVTASLVVVAHRVSPPAVVTTLLSSMALLLLAAHVGMVTTRDLSQHGGVLVAAMTILLVATFLNGLVFRVPWLRTGLLIAGIVIFVLAAVWSANVFVQRRICRHDCCEEGVFSIFLDFANVAQNLLMLQQE